MSIVTKNKILGELADHQSKTFSDIERLCKTSPRSTAKGLRKLLSQGFIVKSESGKIGRGLRGAYTVTDAGLLAYKSGLINSSSGPDVKMATIKVKLRQYDLLDFKTSEETQQAAKHVFRFAYQCPQGFFKKSNSVSLYVRFALF